jgi:hypothetical protein
MKALNRTLTVAIFAIAVVLVLGWLSRTDWAATRDILGAGEGFSNALEPIVKITAAVLISVSGVQLIRDVVRRVFARPAVRAVPARAAGERSTTRR